MDQKFLTWREYNQTSIENEALRRLLGDKSEQLEGQRQLIHQLQNQLCAQAAPAGTLLHNHPLAPFQPQNHHLDFLRADQKMQQLHDYPQHSSLDYQQFQMALLQDEAQRGIIDSEQKIDYLRQKSQKLKPKIHIENCEE